MRNYDWIAQLKQSFGDDEKFEQLRELLWVKYWDNMEYLARVGFAYIVFFFGMIIWLADGETVVSSLTKRIDIALVSCSFVVALTGYYLKRAPTISQTAIESATGLKLLGPQLGDVQKAVGPNLASADKLGLGVGAVVLILTISKILIGG